MYMRDKNRIGLILRAFFLLSLPIGLYAQVIPIGVSTDTTCNRLFADEGGIQNPYPANSAVESTLCSDDSVDTHLSIRFPGGVDLGPGDTLYFFDGQTTAADLLLKVHAGTPQSTFVVEASANNASGCLTIRFTSDGNQQGRGWLGDIECRRQCQSILASFTGSDPPQVPADTGWIDVCIGEAVEFSGTALFPENDAFYNQSLATSTFNWDFGDGTRLEGATVTHEFHRSGGFRVKLSVTDALGCTSSNSIEKRVRVAPKPNFKTGALPPPLCPGDSIALTAGPFNTAPGAATLSAHATTGAFSSGGRRADSIPLPDGVGVSYDTSIYLDQFPPGLVLTSVDQLEGICVNMEHSWMGDLAISITCPNGTNVVLHEFVGNPGGRYVLGEPVLDSLEMDGLVPGKGYDYCWTPDATNLDWSILFSGGIIGTDTIPPGDYQSWEPLTNLLGCPINGEWTIEIQDFQRDDNGFVFNWGVEFSEDLLPSQETFQPNILNGQWVNDPDNISQYDPQTIVAKPSSPGEIFYFYQTEDDFGCIYDTAIAINALSPMSPACSACGNDVIAFQDTTICEFDTLQVNPQFSDEVTETVTFRTNPNYLIDRFTGSLSTPFNAGLPVRDMGAGTLIDPVSTIEEVCFNLDADPTEDLIVRLIAPDGRSIVLLEEVGPGANFSNTCFSPAANAPIGGAPPPFTGTFQPEDSFDGLIGSPLTGEWNLRIEESGGRKAKQLKDWHITFFSDLAYTYDWTPTRGLSCTDCPSPLISPDTTTTYILTVSDQSGCIVEDTLTVNVIPIQNMPPVTVEQVNGQNLEFNWPGLPPGTEYEYRITRNGIPEPWSAPTTQTQLLLPNLPGGTEILLEVRPYDPGGAGCTPQTQSATATLLACNLAFTPSVTEIVCAGDRGTIQLSPSGAYGEVTFQLQPAGTQNNTGTFIDLDAGNYQVQLTDSLGCQEQFNYNLTDPPALVSTPAAIRPVSCFGRSDGIARAEVNGGVPGYTFEWVESGLTDSIAQGLPSGVQTLIVTDNRGCADTSTVNILGPDPITLSTASTNPTCGNTTDGQITATAFKTNGEQLTLIWDSGQTGNTITDLGPGIYCVTATDQFGCSETRCDTLNAPQELTIDSISVRDVSCFGANDGIVRAFASGGTGNRSFSWNDLRNQQNSLASELPAGTYTVEVTDAGGCSVTAQATIDQPVELEVQIATDSVDCRGDSTGQAIATATGGNGPYQFEWNDGSLGTQLPDLAAGPVSVTVTDSSGCTAQANAEVFQPGSFLEVEAVQTRFGCEGDSGNAVEARVIDNPSNTAVSFEWGNGSTGTLQANLPAGPLQLTATDALGCLAFAGIEVRNLDTIEFFIQGNPPTCPGETNGSLGVAIISGGSGTDGADYEYRWNTGDTGPLITGLAGGQVYEVTVTDSVGCQTTEERFLAAPDPISFQLETADILCAGEAAGEARLTNISTQDDQFTILWDPRLNGASGPIIDQLPAGTYSVSVLDGNDCEVDTTFTISEPPALSIELETEDNICFDQEEGSIAATVSGGVPGYEIEWSTGDTTLQIEGLGSDFYTLTVTDSNGCSLTETAAISAPSPIDLRAETDAPSCNRRDDGSLSVSTSGGTGPYLYRIGEEPFGTDSIFTALEPGEYTVAVQDAQFCVAEEQFIIPEPSEVMVDMGTEVIFINPGDTVVLPAEIITSDGAVELVWETNDPASLSCTDCLNPLAFPEFTTVYTLRATDQGGCEGFGRIRVQVSKRNLAFVPTGFTPNQDQENDRLIVHGDTNVRLISFRVFNRWGEQVFENENFEVNDEGAGWDGTIGGKPAPAGVYLWVLEAEFTDGTRQVLDGQTTLIR